MSSNSDWAYANGDKTALDMDYIPMPGCSSQTGSPIVENQPERCGRQAAAVTVFCARKRVRVLKGRHGPLRRTPKPNQETRCPIP